MRNTLILVMFFLFTFVSVSGQPGTGTGGGPAQKVPLGGIELLLIAGGALGVRKLIGTSKKK